MNSFQFKISPRLRNTEYAVNIFLTFCVERDLS